jgi:hypothetical protein
MCKNIMFLKVVLIMSHTCDKMHEEIYLHIKAKQFLYTPWWRLGGEVVLLLLILDLRVIWGVSDQLHALAALCPGERTPGTHYTGGWVGRRAGLDTELEEISLACAGDRTPIARSSSP